MAARQVWSRWIGFLATALLCAAAARAEDGTPPEVRAATDWVVRSGDSHRQPFAVVDKRGARLYVFDAQARLVGTAPALLGLTRGDLSAPGVARRAASFVPFDQRTTPAGRFDAEPGRNTQGEAIVWVDYAAAFAIHRLRPAPPAQRRGERLTAGSADDRRITLGCVVVDPAFYDAVVATTLGAGRGVVYVLPENGDWRAWFDSRRELATAQ